MRFRGCGRPRAPCRSPRALHRLLGSFAKLLEPPLGLFPVGDQQMHDGSNRGDLVAIRLQARRKFSMADGFDTIAGEAPGTVQRCSRQPPTYFACSSFGKRYVICLGTAFWRAWRDRDEATTASTLLHEALHIYFGTLVAHGAKGRYGNANCYERFVMLINGQFLHAATNAACARHTSPC